MAKKKQKKWVDIVDPLECKAKEVLKCPYHGPGSLVVQACPPGYGHLKSKFKVAKVDHGWEVTVPNGVPFEESFKKLSKLVNNSHGGTLFTLTKAGDGIIKVKFNEGGFELPPEEKHLMEADTLSPEAAPSGGEDLVSSEKNIDGLDNDLNQTEDEWARVALALLAEADEALGIEPSDDEWARGALALLAEADEALGIAPSDDAGAPAEMLSNQPGQDVDAGGSTGTDNQQKPSKKGSPAKPPVGVLAPLEHDETKFPKNVTQKKLKTSFAAKMKPAAKDGSKKLPGGQWAKSGDDYAKKQAAKTDGGKRAAPLNAEDLHMSPKSKRIEDHGQKPPKGYMRTGGRYFAKICNARPIQSLTTPAQRALFEMAKAGFLGPDGNGGWVGSAANQGMYDGSTGEMNFRDNVAKSGMRVEETGRCFG